MDLASAYQQLVLDKESQPLTIVNTHQGLCQYTRLPFGVASASALFQRVMDSVLQGLPKVIRYNDDILVTGNNETTHLQNLEAVLRRLQKYRIQVRTVVDLEN